MENSLQIKRRWEMAEYAYRNSSFYIKLARERNLRVGELKYSNEQSWGSIPVIHKGMFIENPDSMISNEYIVKDFANELIDSFTSGTTGTCFNVKWKMEEANKSLTTLWLKRFHEFGIYPHDRYCYFFNARNSLWKERYFDKRNNFALGVYSGALTLERMKEIYSEMIKFDPKWLLLQPSIAEMLCLAKQKYNLPDLPKLSYIELTGEMVRQGLQERIAKVFKSKVRKQYGCNEALSIAYECICGKYHCMDSNVYVEILDEDENVVQDGIEGEICITSLNNHAMPFVRYMIGDRGRLYHNINCECGKTETILELTSGRSSDMIRLRNGEKLSPFTFARVVNIINERLQQGIYQYQIVQKGIDNFEVYLVADSEIRKDYLKEMFLQELNEPLLRRSDFIFYFCEYIPVEKDIGKVRSFIWSG